MTYKMVVSKEGNDAVTETNPSKMIFSSDYNTLKYDTTGAASLEIDAAAGNIADHETITHNFGYCPYVEVYVDQGSSGDYEYCPFWGAGATVFYGATYTITDTTLELYCAINGMSSSTWTFDFKYFIFKNDINLF